jgi:ribosomal protein S27E
MDLLVVRVERVVHEGPGHVPGAAGFARVRCCACGHEQLVAFSCQLRGVCPSCQQKRAELLCRFVIDEVIEPVGHRQLVFVLPKHLRRPFYVDRKLLTGLCRSAVEATHDFYRAGLDRDDLRVGMVVVPQRFGDRVNPHIHLHALATDGAFDVDGLFHPMPFDEQVDIEVLERLFARRVLDLMVRHKRLSRRLRDEMLGWEHSGFSVDGSVSVAVGDYVRLRRLVRYLARPAVSAERVEYDKGRGTVTVRSSKKLQGVRPVVARAHGPPGWTVKYERNDQIVPCRQEEDCSQAHPDWDEWEPA